MSSSLFRRCNRCGAAGLSLPVRRDFPEIILPDAAAPGAQTAGALDALPAAWAQICSAAQWGAAPLILAGIFQSHQTGATLTANNTLWRPRQGRVNIATGAAGAEVTRHEYRYGSQAVVQLTGRIDDPVSAVALATPYTFHRVAPVEYAGNTRLSFRAAVRDNNADRDTRCYAAAYDPAAWNLVDVGIDWEQYLRGKLAVAHEHTDYTLFQDGAAVWANGAWATCNVNGAATADANYLVTGCSLHIDPPVGFGPSGAMADIAIGAAGAEVIQSRVGFPMALVLNGWYSYEFPLGPFLWRTGERMAIRTRSENPVQDYVASMDMVRLP